MRIQKEAKTQAEQKILNYIDENATDELVERMNADSRTLSDCMKYLCGKARSVASGASCVCVTDEEVFGWAIHYFEEDAEQINKENVPKVAANVVTDTSKKENKPEKIEQKEIKKKEDGAKQISLFEAFGIE